MIAHSVKNEKKLSHCQHDLIVKGQGHTLKTCLRLEARTPLSMFYLGYSYLLK